MSLWIRSALLVAAMLLMTGAAYAGCSYAGGESGGTYMSGNSVTFVYIHYYNCDGDLYAVVIWETWTDTDGNGSAETTTWDETTYGPGGGTSPTTSGPGRAPYHGPGSTYDPRRAFAEPDPEY
jgi:hypothetical protein